MQIVIILSLLYIFGMPIIFRLIALLHKKMITERKIAKMGNTRTAKDNMPPTLWSVWKERLKFAAKDKRDVVLNKKKKKNKEPNSSKIQNRQLVALIWLTGLLIVAGCAFTHQWKFIALGYVLFFFAMGFGIMSAKDVVETRKNILNRMFEIGQSKMSLSMEYKNNPGAVILVLEWADYIRPQRVKIQVPTNFSEESTESFLRQFNQIFGTEVTWVPFDDPETGTPGWNFAEGEAVFYAVPPLPKIAPWDEHYVLGEGVAWSFFPIALGVENGLELVNPKTGETENVLGFDFSGEQIKIGKEHGIKVGSEITTSPMVFIGGGTGGGKSLASNTLVRVIKHKNN